MTKSGAIAGLFGMQVGKNGVDIGFRNSVSEAVGSMPAPAAVPFQLHWQLKDGRWHPAIRQDA